MIQYLIIFILSCIALVVAILAFGFSYGFARDLFVRREPLRFAPSAHRRMRWLAAELHKELSKTDEVGP